MRFSGSRPPVLLPGVLSRLQLLSLVQVGCRGYTTCCMLLLSLFSASIAREFFSLSWSQQLRQQHAF